MSHLGVGSLLLGRLFSQSVHHLLRPLEVLLRALQVHRTVSIAVVIVIAAIVIVAVAGAQSPQ